VLVLATIALVGAGTGVGVVFGSLYDCTCKKSFYSRMNFFVLQYQDLHLTEAVGLLGLMYGFSNFI
jgi:F0F1-type ATP synthase membrane subunit c/vacuolar-type H+-ATPase subunit K